MPSAIRRRVAVSLLPGAFLLAGCGDRTEQDAAAAKPLSSASAPASASMPEGTAARVRLERGGEAADLAASEQPAPQTPPGVGRPARAPGDAVIIRTGNASVEVRALDAGLAALRRLAVAHEAWVGGSSRQGGRDQVPEATLELKVPAHRFEGLVAALDSVGRVEYAQVSAEDVTEEAVDLRARRANAQRLETRLLELLATARGRLQDVLAVERELARVREEVERIDGRLRYLETRAAVSTLTVRVHEPVPAGGIAQNPNVIADAFGQAWRNAVSVVAGLIAFIGGLVPVLLLALPLLWLGRRLRRRRHEDAARP